MTILLYLWRFLCPNHFQPCCRFFCWIFCDVRIDIEWEKNYHFYEDFFTCGPPNSDQCLNGLNDCMELAEELGSSIEQIKAFLPTTCLTYLGVSLNSVLLEHSLLEDKLLRVNQALAFWYNRRPGTKRELLSLIGLLQHCCQMITLRYLFLRRFIDKASRIAMP